MTNLKNNVMRRVYYIFALRLVKHPLVTHSAVMVLCLTTLAQVVSIPNVFANMLEVKVGDLAMFWIGAFSNTGSITLVLVGILLVAALSLPWRLRHSEMEELAFH